MSLLRGDETPEEIIVIAYGMERGLGEFYTKMAERIVDTEVANMLSKLSEIEDKHKQRLASAYLSLHKSISDETFESKIVSGMMEGGFTVEEYIDQNGPAMRTIPDVLNIAMMLEAQALDLYMRYSQEITYDKGKTILYDIAEEEKGHLAALGRLIEEKVK
ncbi:ferritin family protein [Thermodesulfobacteriota bacterium]